MYIKFVRFVCGLHCRPRLIKIEGAENFSGSEAAEEEEKCFRIHFIGFDQSPEV
jgi:hypothetical protein